MIFIDGVERKCHLTELVFSVEHSKYEGKDLFDQLFCHRGEQTDPSGVYRGKPIWFSEHPLWGLQAQVRGKKLPLSPVPVGKA